MNGSTEEVSFNELSALNHVPLDDALDALAHIQRRKLLFALLDHNPQDDSPIIVAPTEDETDTLEPVLETYHLHLPKLADYGFIDWNQETHEVAKGPNFDKINSLLELLADHEDNLPGIWL